MIDDMKEFTNKYFCNELRKAAIEFDLTREAMAEQMNLSERQCCNLLSKGAGFGIKSMIGFLTFLPEEYVIAAIRNYRKLVFEKEKNK